MLIKIHAYSVVYIICLLMSFQVHAQKYSYTEQECPVVGNTKKGIYHLPGGQFYKRMLILNKDKKDNRRCFKKQNEAVNAGFRKSKR